MTHSMRRTSIPLLALLLFLAAPAAQAQLVIDDPLTDGGTLGFRDNGPGQFVSGGWMVTGPSDNIRYTPAYPIEEGAVEFDVTGLRFDDTRPQNHRGQLMSMYDASFGNPRHVYAPDIRKNPFKFVLQRNGRDETAYFANYLKFIMNTDGVNQFEEYSSVGPFPWEEGKTYHMRLEWKDGVIRFFIDGQDTDRWPFVYRSLYKPGIHDIRIGTNTRNNAIVGAVYSNVKIFDYGTAPKAPLINNPRAGGISPSLTPIIDWTGERHSHYEVRVTVSPDPNSGSVWSSGEVPSPLHYAVSGPLSDDTSYFAHVRLRNLKGWGDWSPPRSFRTSSRDPVIVHRFGEHEIVLRSSTTHSNPYTGVTLSASFTGPTQSIRVNGFWDGGNLYKIRFLPTEAGVWTWNTSSSDPSLHNRGGSFTCEDSTNRGYVRVSPSLPYTFEWTADGSPFFLMGDTLWHMYYNLRFFDGSFQSLIDDRVAQKFNYAHGVVHDFLHDEGGAIYREQDPDREMFDTDTLNPEFFHVIDRKIDYMNTRGMAAGLFFSWGNEGYQEYETAEQYERYMRYLIARYGSKNVFWIVVGEYEEAGEPRSRWRDYMQEIRDNDPYGHPVSLHPVATTDAFGPDEQMTFTSQQRFGSPEELRELIAESRIFDKPVVNLEYGYEGNPFVFTNNQFPDDVRRDHYALTLAGGYGVYGNHTPWYTSYHRVGDFVLEATDTPGAQYLTILYDFFSDTNFHRLEPAQELVNRGIAAAWRDTEYVVQLPTGGDVRIDLSGADGIFNVDWFNPRTGERSRWGTTYGGDFRSFTAPDGNDWILHIYNYDVDDKKSVRIDLGDPNVVEGLSHPQFGDGETSPTFVGGRSARQNLDPDNDFYFYFDVNDGFAFQGSRPKVFITIDYFDVGSGSLILQYDSAGGSVYQNGGSVQLSGSNAWTSHTFEVSDAYFGNRQNGGSDFRIFGGVGSTFYLDSVRVAIEPPGPPAAASNPNPSDGAQEVETTASLSWTAGLGATAHDVHFGVTNPPPFVGRQTLTTFTPTALNPDTTYFWRVDEVSTVGSTIGPVWTFTTAANSTVSTLDFKPANSISIDGDPTDWNLGAFGSKVRAGENKRGDIAIVGYDEGALFVSGYATHLALPERASDYTARVYGRHDTDSLYFLVRMDDDDIQTTYGTDMNWANDCVEIYVDPAGAGGSLPMNNSTSEIQLVIDAANQKNVYVTTGDYRTQVLGGVASAVSIDGAGWWLEVRILKSVLSPQAPAEGTFGLDFNFRDNDDRNNPNLTSVTTWADSERSSSFPSKIPDRWGSGYLPATSPQVDRPTLDIKPADAITIDGDIGDWNLSEFSSLVRAGDTAAGDVALVGYDGGTLHWAGRYTGYGLPRTASDHTARIYARHDMEYLYFLLRLDDDHIQTPFGPEMNWANDSVEIYIDPDANGGTNPMGTSTSDIQLVIDARNQHNVYMTTSVYKEQVSSAVLSAVSLDATGWWLEVRIQKAALDPDLPALGSFGLDFNFRDNDDNNDPNTSTVYTWSDTEESGAFPSKIPDRWGLGRFQ